MGAAKSSFYVGDSAIFFFGRPLFSLRCTSTMTSCREYLRRVLAVLFWGVFLYKYRHLSNLTACLLSELVARPVL